MRDFRIVLLLCLLGGASPLAAQGRDTTVAAGARYDTGWLHEFFFGKHYRDLWVAPITVVDLDLKKTAGGLKPTERGGGKQTRSLRFMGADGHEYVVRSLDKDPSSLLPPELQGTVAEDIFQDQISAAHPAGPLVARPLAEAVGVPGTKPVLVRIPPDAELGEFQDFAGMVGYFEERPDEKTGNRVLPGARQIVSSDNFFKKAEDSSKDQADALALLRARLFDVFIGDWDRHRDQWRWATFDSSAPRHWQVIPRDRDQAFVRFDGLLLTVARAQAPQLVNFGPKYPSMTGLTWNGRELDRRFLVELEWPAWDSTARAMQAALTDSVIEYAVAQMPAPYLPIDSVALATALKGRRDRLPEAAKKFYRLLAKEVDIHATDERDVVRVERVDAKSTRVTIVREKADGKPWFDRTFHKGETGELRFYVHSGSDSVIVDKDLPLTVRVIGGKGSDTVVRKDGAKVRVYDTDTITVTPDQGVQRKPVPAEWLPEPPTLPPRDWGSMTIPILWGYFQPDVGLLAGGGVVVTDYGFRQQPWASRHLLRAGYATGAQTFKAEYYGDFRAEHKGPYVGVHALASGIEVLRFHGFGNETPATGPNDFYRVRENDFELSVTANFPVGANGLFSIGPVGTWSNTDFDGDRFIDQARPYGSGKFGRVGLLGGFRYDTRDLPGYPRKGVVLDVGGTFRPGIWDVTSTYGAVHGVASTYLSPNLPKSPVLALRAGGVLTFGDYIYQDAAYIGGANNVRLGRERRYAGDASAYASAELRFSLTKFFMVMPGEIGLFGLGDIGRVFLERETSDVWHGAAGGGIWIALLSRANTITFAYAASEDLDRVYIQAGWAF